MTRRDVTTTSAFAKLPSDNEQRRILAERVKLLQDDPGRAEGNGDAESVVVFRLGPSELYAIPYPQAVEILPPTGVTGVPCTPAHIAGVVNRRGELLTVLNLRQFFRTPPAELSGEERIVAVSNGSLTVGLMVDELLGHERVDRNDLAPAIPSDGISNIDHVGGIHRGAVTVIDVEMLLADPALSVEEQVT